MSEETKNTGAEKEETGTFCMPGDFEEMSHEMFKKMSTRCFSGDSASTECKAMMERMKEKFCGSQTKGVKTSCQE